MQSPQFRAPRFGRRGYATHEVDTFVALVLRKLAGHPDGDAVTAADLRVMIFHEPPKGDRGYAADDVDDWMEQVLPEVAAAERTRRSDGSEPQQQEGSVADMPAPPHFADRFPRVSRAVVGYSVQDVDAFLELIRRRLERGDMVDESDLKGLPIGEQQGGYRQTAVHQALDLLALALRRR